MASVSLLEMKKRYESNPTHRSYRVAVPHNHDVRRDMVSWRRSRFTTRKISTFSRKRKAVLEYLGILLALVAVLNAQPLVKYLADLGLAAPTIRKIPLPGLENTENELANRLRPHFDFRAHHAVED